MSRTPSASSASWRRTTGEHAPVVLRRLIALLQSPLFADVDLNELAVLAENAVESTFVVGEQVAPAGQRLPSVHLVLDGRVEMATTPTTAWSTHAAIGLLEVLAGRELSSPAVAATDVRTLELDAADLFEILEENFGLLALLVRSLAVRALELPARWPAAERPIKKASPLGLVDRMILIRERLPLLAVRMQPLTILAHAAREVVWAPGEIVAGPEAAERSVCIIVEGTVAAARNGDEARLLGPGAAFGALEVLAGRPTHHTLSAVTPTRAVTLASSDIFDVLEDHCELGLAIAASMARTLLDAETQGATATTAESNS